MTDDYAKSYFDQLLVAKPLIEQEIGSPLLWQRLEDSKRSQVQLEVGEAPLGQREDWPRQFAWLREYLERFHRAFSNRVKQLKQLGPEIE